MPCVSWSPLSVNAASTAKGFLGKGAILTTTPNSRTCQILERQGQALRDDCSQFKACSKSGGTANDCVMPSFMISHSAPFAATAFLGMSLLLGPPLDKDARPAGTPTRRWIGAPRRVGAFPGVCGWRVWSDEVRVR